MQLKFKSLEAGNSNFVTWLKQFKDVDTSNCLLLEVDTAEKKFVTKVFTSDKFLVKFSQITFEDAGYELVGILGNDGKKVKSLNSRIKCGIFMILSKFIDVVNAFDGAEHEVDVTFDENNEKEVVEYQTENMMFKSKSLKIRVKMGNLSEFNDLSDDTFFKAVYVMSTPIEVEVSKEVLKNVISISGLLSSDSQEEMVFYTKKDDDGKLKMYVKDNHSSTDAGYDYFLGECTKDSNDVETEKIIYRNKFIMVTKSIQDNIMLTLGGSNEKSDQKVFITTTDDNTKNVISTIQY